MKFEKKIFLSIYLTLGCFMILLTIGSFYFISKNNKSQYIKRYISLSEVIAASFKEMDIGVEKISVNAARALFYLEKYKDLPSNKELQTLAKQLSVSHFYVTDSRGYFIRDTDMADGTDPGKNIFNFCDDYKGLLTGKHSMQNTPILPSDPYTGPYKFTMIPNHNKTRILEVGYHMNHISDMLTQVVQSDKNIKSIGFYSPSGFELGSITSNGTITHGSQIKETLPESGFIEIRNELLLSMKVPAMAGYCCECKVKNINSETGDYFYILRSNINLKPFYKSLNNLKLQLFVSLILALFVSFFIARKLAMSLVRALHKINMGVNEVIVTNNLKQQIHVDGKDEFSDLAKNVNRMISSLAEGQSATIEGEKNRVFINLAAQVAHDIRSPLSALGMILSSLEKVDEEKRLVIRNAVQRINDIANDLLSKSKNIVSTSARKISRLTEPQDSQSSSDVQALLLTAHLDSIISEKRTEYRSSMNIKIESDLQEAFGIFVQANSIELARLMSNLINNSVESMLNTGGLITIGLRLYNSKARIQIIDNGKGIPEEILEQLGKPGISFGKEDSKSGNGLGIYHAIKSVEGWGGTLSVKSKIEVGTVVEITLPRMATPSWFASHIQITSKTLLVSVDDDVTIHQIWQNRISEQEELNGVMLRHFTSAAEFSKWMKVRDPSLEIFVLMDYEFLNQNINGLQLVSENQIADKAILVTSRFDEEPIKIEAESLGIKILPKNLAPHIPIELISPSASKKT